MNKFEESKHPRDELGQFAEKDSPIMQKQGLYDGAGSEGTQHPKFIPSPNDKKVLKQKILELKPIKLKRGKEEIIAEFDKYCAEKNAYAQGNSDNAGYKYKFENLEELYNHIKKTRYLKSKSELGKKKPQHKDVIIWHYFIGKIKTREGNFDMVVNVRDKGKNKYIYEISLKKEKV